MTEPATGNIEYHVSYYFQLFLAGLADLNQCDLNHRFQSRFKSIQDDFTYQ